MADPGNRPDRGPAGDALGVTGMGGGASKPAATAGPLGDQRLADGAVVGGLAIRLLPPRLVDLEISFQLRPEEWGKGYAVEAAGALIRWAFAQDIGELYAVAIPGNTRAIATCGRLGMQWVGETNKYYDRCTLQVHRIRPSRPERLLVRYRGAAHATRWGSESLFFSR